MISLYSIALFFHVLGAVGFFIALGLEWVTLQQLQRATTVEQLRERLKATSGMGAIGGISMLVIVVAGVYLTMVAWRGNSMWVAVAFAAIIVQGVLMAILNGPRMRAIRKAATTESGSISSELDGLLHHSMLWISMLVRVGMSTGIIFLMTVKPPLITSLIVIAVGFVLGLAASMFTMGNRRTQTAAA
jgi:hypothetical protein